MAKPVPAASFVDRLGQANGLRQNHARQNHWILMKKNPAHPTSKSLSREKAPSPIGPVILQKMILLSMILPSLTIQAVRSSRAAVTRPVASRRGEIEPQNAEKRAF
jgi:hypothetical protein